MLGWYRRFDRWYSGRWRWDSSYSYFYNAWWWSIFAKTHKYIFLLTCNSKIEYYKPLQTRKCIVTNLPKYTLTASVFYLGRASNIYFSYLQIYLPIILCIKAKLGYKSLKICILSKNPILPLINTKIFDIKLVDNLRNCKIKKPFSPILLFISSLIGLVSGYNKD